MRCLLKLRTKRYKLVIEVIPSITPLCPAMKIDWSKEIWGCRHYIHPLFPLVLNITVTCVWLCDRFGVIWHLLQRRRLRQRIFTLPHTPPPPPVIHPWINIL